MNRVPAVSVSGASAAADAATAATGALTDSGGYYTQDTIETAFQEIGVREGAILTNEVQTLTLSAGAQNDTFKLTYNGHESSAAVTIPAGGFASVTAAQIKTCLLTISDFANDSNSIATSGNGTTTITFSRELGGRDLTAITLTSATGAAAGSVAETTKGGQVVPAVTKYMGGLETVKAIGNSGSTLTLALATTTDGNVQTVTNSASCTYTMPSGLATSTGISFTLIVTNNGAFTATFTGVKWAGGTVPTLTSGAGKVDVFSFLTTDGGTTWYGTVVQDVR